MYNYSLNSGIGPGERNDKHDLADFGRGLERATGLDPWLAHSWTMAAFPEAHTSDGYMPGFGGALRGFQIAAGLYPDGVARSGGPTERTLRAALDTNRVGRRIDADEVYRGAPPGTVSAEPDRPADGGAKAAAKIRKPAHRKGGSEAGNGNAKGKGSGRSAIPTVPPPGIRRSVGAGGVNVHDDLLQAQRNLARLGYAPPVAGIGEPTEARSVAVRNGLRAYQQTKGLKADGRMDPGGATERAVHRQIGVQQKRLKGQLAKDAAEAAAHLSAGARSGSSGAPGGPESVAARTLGARMTGAKVEAQQREAYAEARDRMKRAGAGAAAGASAGPGKLASTAAGEGVEAGGARPLTNADRAITRAFSRRDALRAKALERAETRKHGGLGDIEHEAGRHDRFNVVHGYRLPKSTADLYFRILKSNPNSADRIREDIRRAPLGKFQKSRLYLLLSERLQRPNRPLSPDRAKRYLPYLTNTERSIERLREDMSTLVAGTILTGRPLSGRNRVASSEKRRRSSTDTHFAEVLEIERLGVEIPGVKRSITRRILARRLAPARRVAPRPPFEVVFAGATDGIPAAGLRRLRGSYSGLIGAGGEASLQKHLRVAGVRNVQIARRRFEAGGERFDSDFILQHRFIPRKIGRRTEYVLVRNYPGDNAILDVKTGPNAGPRKNQRIGHAATSEDNPAITISRRAEVIEAKYAQFLKQGFHETHLASFQQGAREFLARQGVLSSGQIDRVMNNLAVFHQASGTIQPISIAQAIAFMQISAGLMAERRKESSRSASHPADRNR